jgi:hypothetical protein
VKKLVANGLKLAVIKRDLVDLQADVEKFRVRALSSAEDITGGLESVESVSFQVLNVVPTLTMMDPIRESIYKISMLLVRASARGAGGGLAYGTMQAFEREAWQILKKEVPPLLIDLLLIWVNRLTRAFGWKDAARDVLVTALQHLLDLSYNIYCTIRDNKGKPVSDEQKIDIFVQAISSLLGLIVSRVFPVRLEDKATKVLIKATAESLAKQLVVESREIYKKCDESGREVSEVLLAEIPTIIMRLVEGTIVGFAQRRASQAAEFGQQQQVRNQTNFAEAHTILSQTNVSTLWRDGRLNRAALMEVRAGRARAIPFSKWEYDVPQGTVKVGGQERPYSWKDTNLEYETAAGVRRYSDECRMLVFFHRPNASRLNHTATPEARGAKWGKPPTVHAKSADGDGLSSELAGLVVKPRDGAAGVRTHNDVEAALKGWAKYEAELTRNGNMVRPDGVAFHPDQLAVWARLAPHMQGSIRNAMELLPELQRAGVWDLSDYPSGAQQQKLMEFVRGKAAKMSGGTEVEREDRVHAMIAEVKSTLQASKIGYYSDLDLIDLVSEKTGESIHLGNMKNEAVDIAKENMRLVNEYVSRDLEGRNEYREPHQSTVPGTGGEQNKLLEYRESEVLHGASLQMYGKGKAAGEHEVRVKDGATAVGPGGEVVQFYNKIPPEKLAAMTPDERSKAIHEDIIKQWDDYVRTKTSDKLFKPQVERIDKIKKEDRPLRHKVKKATAKPPKITREELRTVKEFYAGIEIVDDEGLGTEIGETSVMNSLHARDLVLDARTVATTLQYQESSQAKSRRLRTWADFEFARTKQGTVVGVHSGAASVVIAARLYRNTMGEAIAALIETRRGLGSINSSIGGKDVKMWFEIYSAYRPVATEWMRDRIGPAATGVTPANSTYGDQCPTLSVRPNLDVVAFTIKGLTHAFTPPGDPNGDFQGLWLHEVVEDKKTKELEEKPVTISDGGKDCYVAVFTSPLDDDSCPVVPMSVRREVSEKSQAEGTF